MIITIESNGLTIALARKEDVIECADASMANTLRSKGYVHLGDGATSRPATDTEQAAYKHWQAGLADTGTHDGWLAVLHRSTRSNTYTLASTQRRTLAWWLACLHRGSLADERERL
jgi:hypothetical protein